MATLILHSTGELIELRQGIRWLQRHRTDIDVNGISIMETAGGAATVTAITDQGDVFTEDWRSFEVASAYFGTSRGWGGNKVLQSVTRTFINLRGDTWTVKYSEVVHRSLAGVPDGGVK